MNDPIHPGDFPQCTSFFTRGLSNSRLPTLISHVTSLICTCNFQSRLETFFSCFFLFFSFFRFFSPVYTLSTRPKVALAWTNSHVESVVRTASKPPRLPTLPSPSLRLLNPKWLFYFTGGVQSLSGDWGPLQSWPLPIIPLISHVPDPPNPARFGFAPPNPGAPPASSAFPFLLSGLRLGAA